MAKYKVKTGTFQGHEFDGKPVEIGGEARIWDNGTTGRSYPASDCEAISTSEQARALVKEELKARHVALLEARVKELTSQIKEVYDDDFDVDGFFDGEHDEAWMAAQQDIETEHGPDSYAPLGSMEDTGRFMKGLKNADRGEAEKIAPDWAKPSKEMRKQSMKKQVAPDRAWMNEEENNSDKDFWISQFAPRGVEWQQKNLERLRRGVSPLETEEENAVKIEALEELLGIPPSNVEQI